MYTFYPCYLPLCNNQMLIEDYSNAIYWRIAAIFSTIAALFSVAIVLWFLIFRDNPNLPDETDSVEKSRFENNILRERYNLISEIVYAFRHFPRVNFHSSQQNLRSKHTSQNFLQRLAYFFFGTRNDDCSSDEFDEDERVNLTKARTKGDKNDQRIQSVDEITAKSKKANKNNKQANEPTDNYRKFFNATKKSLKENSLKLPKGKNNNNNNMNDNANNNNRRQTSISDPYLTSGQKLIKKHFYSQFELETSSECDHALLELNKNFSNFRQVNYADALVSLYYHKSGHSISIDVHSISNVSQAELANVRLLVDVIYKRKHLKQLWAKQALHELKPNTTRTFKFKFYITLSPKINVNLVKINIILIGDLVELSASKKSTQNDHLLGGVKIRLKDILSRITVLD